MGGQNGGQDRFFSCFLSVFFFERALASMLGGFLEPGNETNQQKPLFFQWFLLIFTKSTFSKTYAKKAQFWLHFGRPQPLKIDKKSSLKLMCFSTQMFLCVFQFFSDFGLIWEAPGAPQMVKKILKTLSGRVWSAFRRRLDFRYDFGGDVKAIFADF